MKKLLVVCFLFCFICVSCGDDMWIEGKKYETYGMINKDEIRDPKIEYRLIIGNVVWACILFQTAFAPVYFIGFSIYEPVGLKKTTEEIGYTGI